MWGGDARKPFWEAFRKTFSPGKFEKGAKAKGAKNFVSAVRGVKRKREQEGLEDHIHCFEEGDPSN